MPGTGAGWDSCLYRIFVVGGIFFIVAATVVTALTQPPSSHLPIYVGVASAVGFLVLVVAYWAVQIILKGYGAPKAVDLSQKGDVNDLSLLQSWDKLFASMAVNGGDPEKMKALEKKGRSSLIVWFVWAAVIALCPMTMMVPYAFGYVEWSVIKYGVLCYIGLALVMTVVSFVIANRAAKISDELYFVPLGLKLSALPDVYVGGSGAQVRGGTVIEGQRFGRRIKITLGMNRITTQVSSATSPFDIKSQDGDLEAVTGAPIGVTEALRGLRKAKRWEGLSVVSDGQVVTATRPLNGQNMWLYDLWLIERILQKG